jgi:hypothetical protein
MWLLDTVALQLHKGAAANTLVENEVIKMKRVLFAAMVLLGALLSGCNQGTPGGPGAPATSDKKSEVMQANDSFNLSSDLLPTSIKQGERIATSIGIKRGNNFDEDVSLKFSNVPAGVKLEPSSAVIKHGDTEVKFDLEAGKDASLGDFTILVTGHPTKGADAELPFKISVKKS